MTLGDLVKKYREINNISMDEFSKKCELSKGYISMLENNTNPRNNRPIAPTLPTIKKISYAMDTDLDTVLKALDGNQEINLDSIPEIFSDTKHTKESPKNEPIPMEMGEKIYHLRTQKGMTLEELGNMVGVGKNTIKKWESGTITNMKRDKILKVSKALGISPAYLMGWEQSAPEQKEPLKIVQYYEMLNDIGRREATKRVEELSHIEKYTTKNHLLPDAAHTSTNQIITEEMLQHDEDIMDDDNF